MVSVIEELDVKVLPAAFESNEKETGAALVSPRAKIGGHCFEAGHTNRLRTGSERDPAHALRAQCGCR